MMLKSYLLLRIIIVALVTIQFASLHQFLHHVTYEADESNHSSTSSSSIGIVQLPKTHILHRESKYDDHNKTYGTTSTTIMIPKDGPDPAVWKHLSYAWTGANGTEILRLKETDPYISKLLGGGECPPTSQLRLQTSTRTNYNMKESGETSWIISSLDGHGNSKTMGGDEFYVTYRENYSSQPTAVAYSVDQGDGTYQLDFVSTPYVLFHDTNFSNEHIRNNNSTAFPNIHGGGFLTIHLQYTCGWGMIPFGDKQNWRTGGAIMKTYKDIKVPRLFPRNIRSFQQPNLDGQVDLAKYKRVVMFGDSNLQDLYTNNAPRFPNLKFASRPEAALAKRTMKQRFLPKILWYLNETIHQESQDVIGTKDNRYALLLGSACWDIVFGKKAGRNFGLHIWSLEEMLTSIQDQFPSVDVYWHSGYALHIHVAGMMEGWEDREPLKYMSFSRSQLLYKKQMDLINKRLAKSHTTVLDFMDATYLLAEYYKEGDARHVQPDVSRLLLGWYYPNYSPQKTFALD